MEKKEVYYGRTHQTIDFIVVSDYSLSMYQSLIDIYVMRLTQTPTYNVPS